MNRYVIARVSCSSRASVDLVELGEVDRHAFFRICFHMARNVPRPARPRSASSSLEAVQP
jgi:hypothetical protein